MFRGYDRVLQRPVAVEVFPAGAGDRGRVRGWPPARVLAGLDHPALLVVYDAGVDADRGFVVTPLVEGPTLAERLEAGALSVAETVGVGVALGGALGCVHRAGLVHRGISPSAVLLDAAGRCYLGDWGLAAGPAPAAVTADPAITADPAVPGGIAVAAEGAAAGCYLSPEQVTGSAVGPPADIYALGLVLLECLTGHCEYPGDPVAAAAARLHRSPHIPADLPRWRGARPAPVAAGGGAAGRDRAAAGPGRRHRDRPGRRVRDTP